MERSCQETNRQGVSSQTVSCKRKESSKSEGFPTLVLESSTKKMSHLAIPDVILNAIVVVGGGVGTGAGVADLAATADDKAEAGVGNDVGPKPDLLHASQTVADERAEDAPSAFHYLVESPESLRGKAQGRVW